MILQFFLKATQLEQMLLDYTRANEQREITKEIIEKKQQVTIFYDKFIHVYGNIICI